VVEPTRTTRPGTRIVVKAPLSGVRVVEVASHVFVPMSGSVLTAREVEVTKIGDRRPLPRSRDQACNACPTPLPPPVTTATRPAISVIRSPHRQSPDRGHRYRATHPPSTTMV